jgi:hypothetical protein
VEGPPIITVRAIVNEATVADEQPGLLVVRSSRPLRTPLTLPFSLSGTAREYVDYVTDVVGRALEMQPGQDSLTVSVFPLGGSAPGSRAMNFAVQYNQPPTDGVSAPLTASVAILGGPPPTDFRVFSANPRSGGNVGVVTLTIVGRGFTSQSTVQLTGGSEGTIEASAVRVDDTGNMLEAKFSLAGRPVGLRNILIEDGSGGQEILTGAFTVEPGIFPDVHVEVMAPPRVPRTRERTYTILLRNRGNVDVLGSPELAGLPVGTNWHIDESRIELTGRPGIRWRDIAPVRMQGDVQVIRLPPILLGPGQTYTVDVHAAIDTPQTIRLVAAWMYH